jgi:hypothetical protein
MIQSPKEPEVALEQVSEANFALRYEDITQEGRLKLASIPNAFSDAIWRTLLSSNPMYRSCFEQGILPILSRFVLSCEPTSVSPQRPLRVKARYQMAQAIAPTGETERLLLNFWATLWGKPGHPLSPVPESDTFVLMGSAFGEHIFTRPFASKEERKVLSLAGVEGAPTAPPVIQPWSPPQALLQLPEGALWLDSRLVPDESPTVFGMMHTDGNQHVNSLVYPKLFEEALLRRLSVLGKPTDMLARQLDVRYRKPCFAGERLRVWLQLFTHEGSLGAVGVLLPEQDTNEAPRLDLGRSFVSLRMG